MTDKAVIAGSLVNAVNIASHKSVRLHIDVPAELGQRIVEAFGWPTQAAPVAVAVARIVEGARPAKPSTEPLKAVEGPRKRWRDSTPTFQASIRCTEPEFWEFMRAANEEHAAGLVRRACGVTTRANIIAGEPSGDAWARLEERYQAHLAERQYGELVR
jgi:hypothetical protein